MPDIGAIFVWTGLICLIGSIISYIVSLRVKPTDDTKSPIPTLVGRGLFIGAAISVFAVALRLMTLLLTHRFDFDYVYRYSARGLPFQYLFATFWAGQEGSFLLWAFWTAVLGLVLLATIGRKMEPRVIPIYSVVLGFLLVLLATKSPFVLYSPKGDLDPVGIPTDGVGLNPLLENPWMVIHPPTLFLGFASLAVTFVLAVQAVFFNDFENWYRRTWPWALFSFAVLGFGIMLGGYWAYETLGWGGFWGWDPVEIGPLVPWLAMTAFVHSVQVQNARGGLKKTTLYLGMFPFVLALYETFLTRTGILANFSTHSFSTLGGPANNIILYAMLTAVVFSIALLIWRGGKIKNDSEAMENPTSRDFGLTMAIVILLLCAVISGIGMSAPLITQLGVTLHIVKSQSSVQPDFYNQANFPIAVLLMIGMSIGPYLTWRQTKPESVSSLVTPYAFTVFLTLIFFIAGRFLFGRVDRWYSVVLFASTIFCIVSNVVLLKPKRITNPESAASFARTAGGALAHIGAAMLLLGVVFLVAWYRVSDQTLVAGHSAQIAALPMTMTYVGDTSNLHDPANLLKFDVIEGQPKGNQTHYIAYMPVAVRSVEGRLKLLARPEIIHRWWGDLYFAMKDGPEQISPTLLFKGKLAKGETQTLAGYRVQFVSFFVSQQIRDMVMRGQRVDVYPVTATVNVTSNTGVMQTIKVDYIQNLLDPTAETSPEVYLPKGSDKLPWALAFTGMDADTGSAQFYVRDAAEKPVTAYTIEVSTRPMIGFVWLGTVLIALGGLLSMRRRALELKINPAPVPDQELEAPTKRRTPSQPALKGRKATSH